MKIKIMQLLLLSIILNSTIFLYGSDSFLKDKEVIIKLRSITEVNKNNINLSDIALIIGDERLKNLKIFQFTLKNDQFLLNKRVILNKIVSFYTKNNESAPKIKIFGNNIITVKKKYYIITATILKNLIQKFLTEHKQEIFNNRPFKIIKIICPSRIKIPNEKVDIKLNLLNELKVNKLPFKVEFIEKGKVLHSIKVYAFTQIIQKVVVAKANIYMRKIILPEMLTLKETIISNPNENYFNNINDVIGKLAKRFIRAGEPISDSMIQLPPLVRRGEIVNVIAKSSKGIIINTKAKALENGILNKPIRVLNLKSGKVFQAIVKGYGEVVVYF